jgi:uncharacterized membrane protein SpoIIM required for sporulation
MGSVARVSADTRDRFITEHEAQWAEADALLAATSPRDRLRSRSASVDDVLRLGALQRSLSGDLAFARATFPNDPITVALERRVSRITPVLYDRPPSAPKVVSFWRRTYWRLVAERPALLGTAWVLMIAPAVAVAIWAINAPERASLLLGDRFQGRTSAADLGLSVGKQTQFASEIFVNNIRVSIFAFALGILCCVGTVYLLVFNGAMLGMVIGISIVDGYGDVAVALIVAHGVLELSIIVVAAYAGMRIGMAVIRPGDEPRRRVITREAQSAVMLVLGTMPFFVLAGLIEGFITPAGFGIVAASIIGVVVGGAYWVLVWRLGFAPLRRERYALADAVANR